MTTKETSIKLEDDTFYKINADNTGFYRTCYPPARLIQLGKQIGYLSTSDKIGLMGDAGALAISGQSTTSALLAFLESFTTENEYLVWLQIANSLDTIQSIFSDDVEISRGLQAFVLKLTNDAVNRIGWTFHPGEDYLTGQFRALLTRLAGINGNKK